MRYGATAALVAVAVLLLVAGCARPRLVPLPDGGVVDAARRSATQTQAGVTVTVRLGAWVGSPRDLEQYVLPVHVGVGNDAGVGVTLAPRDIVLLDDEGRQYNAIPPAEVAQMLRMAVVGATPIFAPWPHRRRVFFDPFFDPFGPWWWYAPPRYLPVHDVLGLALQPGTVRPGARVEGFVYFSPPFRSARHFELILPYEMDGVPREFRFPFALEHARR